MNDTITKRVNALPVNLREKLKRTLAQWQAQNKPLDQIDWGQVISALEDEAERQASLPPAVYYRDMVCIPQAQLERMTPWQIAEEEKRQQAELVSEESVVAILRDIKARNQQCLT